MFRIGTIGENGMPQKRWIHRDCVVHSRDPIRVCPSMNRAAGNKKASFFLMNKQNTKPEHRCTSAEANEESNASDLRPRHMRATWSQTIQIADIADRNGDQKCNYNEQTIESRRLGKYIHSLPRSLHFTI
jgi:hypothetical protein